MVKSQGTSLDSSLLNVVIITHWNANISHILMLTTNTVEPW